MTNHLTYSENANCIKATKKCNKKNIWRCNECRKKRRNGTKNDGMQMQNAIRFQTIRVGSFVVCVPIFRMKRTKKGKDVLTRTKFQHNIFFKLYTKHGNTCTHTHTHTKHLIILTRTLTCTVQQHIIAI